MLMCSLRIVEVHVSHVACTPADEASALQVHVVSFSLICRFHSLSLQAGSHAGLSAPNGSPPARWVVKDVCVTIGARDLNTWQQLSKCRSDGHASLARSKARYIFATI